MPRTTASESEEDVTFNLSIDVLTPAQLEQALKAWRGVLEAAAKDAEGVSLAKWSVTTLGIGSLYATYTPVAESQDVRRTVVTEVKTVAASIGRGNGVLTNPKYAGPVRDFLNVVKVAPITVEVQGQEIEIGPEATMEIKQPMKSIGSIQGRILTISHARGMSCILYDDATYHGIACRVPLELRDRLREAWDRRVIVSGVISRHPDTGLPSAITNVTAIDPLDFAKGDYRKARGMFASQPGDPKPEEMIRKIRDAS
jgi:hypothetical protein